MLEFHEAKYVIKNGKGEIITARTFIIPASNYAEALAKAKRLREALEIVAQAEADNQDPEEYTPIKRRVVARYMHPYKGD